MTEKFIVIHYPDDYETYINEFDNINDAIEDYQWAKKNGDNPILTKVIEVKEFFEVTK